MSYKLGTLDFHYYGDDGSPAAPGKGAQIIHDILKEARETGKKFEDPFFPANNSSFGEIPLEYGDGEPFTIEWHRPETIAEVMFPESPIPVFHGSYDEFGVNQGTVGDCWFLAVLADVALKPDCINQVVPADNDTFGFDSGAFHFRFWCRGKWLDIVVDDRLPCIMNDGVIDDTLFTKPSAVGGFWAPLLEKAYAKMYGKYADIEGGYGGDAMLDFTGGFVQCFTSEDVHLKAHIKEAHMYNSIMAIGTKDVLPEELLAEPDPENPGVGENVSKEGIVMGHEYSILDIQDVYDNNDSSKVYTLLKLRNPWGNDTEWNGDFSDTDPNNMWATVNKDLRKPDVEKRNDGEFWVSFESMLPYIDEVESCRWQSHCESQSNRDVPIRNDATYFIREAYFTVVNSGHVSKPIELLGKSGYFIHLTECNSSLKGIVKHGLDYSCQLVVTMLYLNYFKSGNDPSIPNHGFYVAWAPGHVIPNADFLSKVLLEEFVYTKNEEARRSTYQNNLPEGTVYIVPWIDQAPSKPIPYILRIAVQGNVYPISM